MAGEEDFTHYIAVFTEMFSFRFYSQVVKTEEMIVSILFDYGIADAVETKNDVSGGNDLIRSLMGH